MAINVDSDSNDAVEIGYGGTGSQLSDPGADRILFWDDSAAAGSNMTWLAPGTGLSVTATTLNVTWPVAFTSGYSSDFDAAVVAIGATPTTLFVDDATAMSTNVTTPATLTTIVLKGGSIDQATNTLTTNGPLIMQGGTIDNDAALTINGSFTCGKYQCFDNTGYGTFGDASVTEVYPEWWGKNTTPGTTDMTAEINTAAASGASKVLLTDTSYLVSKTGTYTYRAVEHNYCLLVPSNTEIELSRGTTIKLANAANSHIFMNSGIDGGSNDNIKIHGGTLDSNQANQTNPAAGTQSGICMHTVTRLILDDIKFTNCREFATYITGITGGSFTNLYCTDSDGSGFHFGLIETSPTYDMTDCFFDNIRSESCAGTYTTYGSWGNGFIFHGHYCHIGTLDTNGDNFGIKINESTHTTIDRVITRNTTTYGFKIQGTDTDNRCEYINVGEVISQDNVKSGTFIEYADDISIGSIISEGDGTGAADPGCWIGEGDYINIGSINVKTSGQVGVAFRDDCQYVNVGSILVRNSTGANITIEGDDINIGEIITVDDQTGSETVTRGIDITANASNISIGRVQATGSFTQYPMAASATCTSWKIDDFVVDGSRIKTTTTSIDAFSGYKFWKVNYSAGAATISAFNHPCEGLELKIEFLDANATVDFTGTTLKGNGGANWTPAAYDWMECWSDGTNWFCSVHDCSA